MYNNTQIYPEYGFRMTLSYIHTTFYLNISKTDLQVVIAFYVLTEPD